MKSLIVIILPILMCTTLANANVTVHPNGQTYTVDSYGAEVKMPSKNNVRDIPPGFFTQKILKKLR